MIPKEIIDGVAENMQLLSEKFQKSDSKQTDREIFLSLARDEEERRDIEDLCDETELYYEERKKLKASGKSAYRYLEQRSIELYQEENPDASDEDQNRLLEHLRNSIDKIIMRLIHVFSNETRNDGGDDSVYTEKELTSFEEDLRTGNDILLPESNDNGGKEQNNE